jgi:hypothetical protein
MFSLVDRGFFREWVGLTSVSQCLAQRRLPSAVSAVLLRGDFVVFHDLAHGIEHCEDGF